MTQKNLIFFPQSYSDYIYHADGMVKIMVKMLCCAVSAIFLHSIKFVMGNIDEEKFDNCPSVLAMFLERRKRVSGLIAAWQKVASSQRCNQSSSWRTKLAERHETKLEIAILNFV